MKRSVQGGSSADLEPSERDSFRKVIYAYYQEHRRALPWRQTLDPYRILVSEIMLQQTQVQRVMGKYEGFVACYPDFATLAAGSLRGVLSVWQGLGYNRRAALLQSTAQRVMQDFHGRLPDSEGILRGLPGIGPGTAGAICAFAFRQPVVFIETNIRRVFLHFFFPGKTGIRDSQIRPIIEATLDRSNVREWYYALMDYGSMLKGVTVNPNRRSAHHHSQSRFEGSDRQIRGRILRALVAQAALSEGELFAIVGEDEGRTRRIAAQLIREGLVTRDGERFAIPIAASSR
jgi:A/G-specific adenine glycosylase